MTFWSGLNDINMENLTIQQEKNISMIRIFKFTLFLAMLFLSVNFLNAQERIKVDKKEFKQTEEGFKTAWKNIRKGNFLFNQHKAGS